MKTYTQLKSTTWLAEVLGLSVRTVEKRRAQNPELLPPHILVGKTIRYSEKTVQDWIQAKSHDQSQPALAATINPQEVAHG